MFKTRLGIRQPLMFAAIGVLSTIAYALIYAALRETASAHLWLERHQRLILNTRDRGR